MPILGIIASSFPRPNFMGAWSSAGTFTAARSRPVPVVLGSTIYYVTGDLGGAATNTAITFSTGNGSWSANSSFAYQCLGPIAGVINSTTAHFAAGFGGGANHFSSTDMSTFTSQTAFPATGMRSASGIGFNNKFFTSGGYRDPIGGFDRSSYSFSSGTWTTETSYPIDTDTPGMFAFNNSKYYFVAGSNYSYSGGTYTAETNPPAGIAGFFLGQTVYQRRVYLSSGGNTSWYSWTGSGGWRTETSSTGTTWGGAILGNVMISKVDGYNTTTQKSTIG
jgi:hypothetical protein